MRHRPLVLIMTMKKNGYTCSLAFKQLLESAAYLLDHVRGGGRSAVFVEGLAITLPCQRRSTECSYQRGIHAGKKEHLLLN